MDELTSDETEILRKKLLESGIALSLDLVKGSLRLCRAPKGTCAVPSA